MDFKHSVWWGLAGAVGFSLISLLAIANSEGISSSLIEFFLSLGLNPREQAPWCILLFFGSTSIIGYVIGQGLSYFNRCRLCKGKPRT